MNPKYKPHILLFTVNLIYAGNFTVAKIAMPEFISPNAFIVIRAALGAVFFFLMHALFVKEKVEKGDWGRLVLCGLFGVALNQLLFFKGLAITSPINASLIMILAPIIVLIISAIVLREAISALKILGVICGLVGAALIILSGAKFAELSISKGDLFIFINATSYAFYLVLVKSLMKKYQPITVVRWVFFFGFFMVLPFGITEVDDVAWSSLPSKVWFSIVYVLMGTTILTYLLNATALKLASATLVSTYIYLQPLLAATIAIGFGKDFLDWKKVLAGAFIFLGVYFVSYKKRTPNNLKIADKF